MEMGKQMTAAMWSGGKDSCLAVWRAVKSGVRVDKLVCMMHRGKSRAHGVDADCIKAQGDAIGMDVVVEEATWESYGDRLKRVFKEINADRVVFGDIYLQEHREWIENICDEMGIEPIFPLWGEDTLKLAKEFISDGFEAYIIAVRKGKLSKDFLGRKFDLDFVEFALENGIDPCGEDGEFHTYVVDGPIFRKKVPIDLTTGEIFESEKYYHMSFRLKRNLKIFKTQPTNPTHGKDQAHTRRSCEDQPEQTGKEERSGYPASNGVEGCR